MTDPATIMLIRDLIRVGVEAADQVKAGSLTEEQLADKWLADSAQAEAASDAFREAAERIHGITAGDGE